MEYGITFGGMLEQIKGSRWTVVWIFIGFIIVLVFRNSSDKFLILKVRLVDAIFTAILIFTSCISPVVLNLNFYILIFRKTYDL